MLSPGARIGQYEVIRKLGAGSFGAVYEARAKAGERLAVKLLTSPTEESRARFQRERELLEELGDLPGIVALRGAGVGLTGPYLAFELYSGGTLRERLDALPERRLRITEALALCELLAETLGRLHERGILHRDLKPENILFDDQGEPVIADLGLGRDLDERAAGLSLTSVGQVLGTPHYMAPEQAEDARQVGPSADVFSLCAVLYECLTGRPPFSGTSSVAVIAKAARGIFRPLPTLLPELPEELVALVHAGLSPEPEDRPADGAALQRQLIAIDKRLRRWQRRATGLLLITAGALIPLLIALAAHAALSPLDPRAPAEPPSVGSSEDAPSQTQAPIPPEEPPAPPDAAPALAEDARWPALADRVQAPGWSLDALALDPGGCFATPLTALAPAPEGRVVAGSAAGIIRAWDPKAEADAIAIATGWEEGVGALCALRDGGRLLASARGRPELHLYDLGTGQRRARWTLEAPARAIFERPDERCAVVTTAGVELWDVARGARLALRPTFGPPLNRAADLGGGELLVAGAGGRLLHLDASGQVLHRADGDLRGYSSLLALPGGSAALAGTIGGALELWRLRPFALVDRNEGDPKQPVLDLATLPDGRVVGASRPFKLDLWSPEAPLTRADFSDLAGQPTRLVSHPEGLIVGASDGFLRHLRLDGYLGRRRGGYDDPPYGLRADRAGRFALTWDRAGRAFEVELETRVLKPLRWAGSGIITGAISPNGRIRALASKTRILFHRRGAEELNVVDLQRELAARGGSLTSLALRDDGRFVAGLSNGRAVLSEDDGTYRVSHILTSEALTCSALSEDDSATFATHRAGSIRIDAAGQSLKLSAGLPDPSKTGAVVDARTGQLAIIGITRRPTGIRGFVALHDRAVKVIDEREARPIAVALIVPGVAVAWDDGLTRIYSPEGERLQELEVIAGEGFTRLERVGDGERLLAVTRRGALLRLSCR